MTRLFYCFIEKYKNFYACDVTIKSLGLDNRDRFAGEKIPTLEEAVEECIKLQLTIYFDVKGHPDEVKKKSICDTVGLFHLLVISIVNIKKMYWIVWTNPNHVYFVLVQRDHCVLTRMR